MVPGSSRTVIMGVNDYGDLVGFYTKSADGTTHGFIWYHQNVLKTIDFPGVANATIPFGINKAGMVVGGFWSTGSAGTGPPGGGWIWINGTFYHMDPNNDAVEVTPSFISVAFPKSGSTYPFGLNDKRWIAGTYSDSAGVLHGFIAKPNF